jgi:hypothetical protein
MASRGPRNRHDPSRAPVHHRRLQELPRFHLRSPLRRPSETELAIVNGPTPVSGHRSLSSALTCTGVGAARPGRPSSPAATRHRRRLALCRRHRRPGSELACSLADDLGPLRDRGDQAELFQASTLRRDFLLRTLRL